MFRIKVGDSDIPPVELEMAYYRQLEESAQAA